MRISDWSSDVCSSDLGILCNPPRACLGEGDHAKHGGGGREMLRDVAPKPESRTVTRSRRLRRVMSPPEIAQIGRAHVCTPVTNATLVCRLMLEKTKQI